MRQLTSAFAVFAVMTLVACSGASSPDGGVDAGPPDAGPVNVWNTPLDFTPISAVPVWNLGKDRGIAENFASAFMSNTSRDVLCSFVASYGTTPSVVFPPTFLYGGVLVSPGDGGNATVGSYTAAEEQIIVFFLSTGDGGVHSTDSTDGGVTITNLVWPTSLGNGWYTGGEIDGTFNVAMDLDDGGLTSASAVFQATGCDYEPLTSFF